MVQKNESASVRPRGRPRKFDETKVLEQARDVFWANGYAATSVDDLAAATGLNRPSLYAAFGDKHALYLRALNENRILSVEGVRNHMRADIPLRDALEAFFTAAAASTLVGEEGSRGCFIVCTAVTEALRDDDTRSVAAHYVTEVDSVFRERFERSADELNIGVDPASAAAVASAVLQSLAIRARTGSSAVDLSKVAEAAVTVICKAPSARRLS